MVEGRKESVFPLFCSSEHRTIIFLLEPRERVDLNNGLCVLICVGIYPACLASVMLQSLVSWTVRAVREEWDSRVGKWRQREKERERDRERKRGEEGERLKEREKGSASLLRWFPMKLILIPPEISHCPLSPLRPASITYLSRGWMIYTLPMSTTDRYTHQRLPVLRDLTHTLKRQRQRQNRKDVGEEMAKGGERKEKRSKLMMEMSMGKRKSKQVRGKPPKPQGWKRVWSVWLGQHTQICRWRQ